MNNEKLQVAKEEVLRFLKRVDELEGSGKRRDINAYPKECAAVKRSSMDLTRSLAELRKPY